MIPLKTPLKTIAKRVGPIKQYLRPFIERYEQLFEPIRHKPLTLLEIGIGGYKDPDKGGGSLRMWSEYFPAATIVGLDCFPKNMQFADNVKIELGSQIDVQLLEKLAEKYGRFDIIIDDASHITSYTIQTFETLWKHTRLFYIVEDLHMMKAKGTREYFERISRADFHTKNLCVITK